MGALGALGRRFESCRPDHLNPSHSSELPRLAFLLQKYDHSNCGQIVVKYWSLVDSNISTFV